jgi:hypothetical protein
MNVHLMTHLTYCCKMWGAVLLETLLNHFCLIHHGYRIASLGVHYHLDVLSFGNRVEHGQNIQFQICHTDMETGRLHGRYCWCDAHWVIGIFAIWPVTWLRRVSHEIKK